MALLAHTESKLFEKTRNSCLNPSCVGVKIKETQRDPFSLNNQVCNKNHSSQIMKDESNDVTKEDI